MKENLKPSDHRIIDCLKSHYGIEVHTLTYLALGADTNASVYKAETQSAAYFIKLKLGHNYDISIAILKLLHNAGIEEIIAPIATIQGDLSVPLGPYTLIVYPFVEGEDGFTQPLSQTQWYKLGKVLKKIHECRIPQSIEKQIRRETFSSKWQEVVRAVYPLIDEPLSSDSIAIMLQTFMKKHKGTIQRLVNRAEELGQKIRKLPTEFVLCHSDIHGGNVLIDKERRFYIVDWDDPIMAPKERDLMFIGGGVANVWNNPDEEDFFYQGYGETKVNQTILSYYRHVRIVEDIAIYAQSLLSTTEGGDDRGIMYKHFIDMFEPQGVVDIAFKTDESLNFNQS